MPYHSKNLFMTINVPIYKNCNFFSLVKCKVTLFY